MRIWPTLFILIFMSMPAAAGCVEDLMSMQIIRTLPSQIAREEGIEYVAVQADFATFIGSMTQNRSKFIERFYVNEPEIYQFLNHDLNHLLPIAKGRKSPVYNNGTSAPIFVFKPEVLDMGDWWIAHKVSLLSGKPKAFHPADSMSAEQDLRAYFRLAAEEQMKEGRDTNPSALVLGYAIPAGMLVKMIVPTAVRPAEYLFHMRMRDLGAPNVEVIFSDDFRPN